MQTNRINGEATIDLVQGREPRSRVGIRGGGTLNHKLEGAEVEVGFHCLFKPNEALAATAVNRCIELLELQEAEGFMLGEVWTDSHSPIYLRAMAALRLWVLRMGKATEKGTPVAGTGKLPQLSTLLENWFEYLYTSCQLGFVPRGPHKGKVVLPCNRKASDEKLGVKAGVHPDEIDDMVRRVWFSLVSSGKPGPTGREFFTLDKVKRPDTAAGPLTRMVLAEGGFGPNLKRGTLPKLVARCEVSRYEDGHAISFPDGLPGADRWTATSCWIHYDSGRYAFDGSKPDLSGPVKRFVELDKAA